MMKRNLMGTALLAGAFVLGGVGNAEAQESGNIVEVAIAAGSFNTLVAAVQAAGLAETLAEGGPFTVFAPTDEAFARIPEADLEALLADKEKLTQVLLYHVVSGKVPASAVMGIESAETMQGSSVSVTITADGKVKVNDATVVATDVAASNGIIHVIDRVILPPM